MVDLYVEKFNNLTREIDKIGCTYEDYLILATERSNTLNLILKHPSFDRTKRYFLLPQIKPDIYVSCDIAIVGNSVTLLNHMFGTEIDQHTDVVRFNYAYTKGYEAHSGKKTTLYIAGYPAFLGGRPEAHPDIDHMDYNYYQNLKNSKIVVYYRGDKIVKSINKMTNVVNKKNNKVFHLCLDNRDHFNRFLRSKDIKNFDRNLQSGSILMMLLVDLGLKPNLYGFDLKYCNDNYYYYWDIVNKKCLQLSRFHNYNDEFFIPNKLNSMGLIDIKTHHKDDL